MLALMAGTILDAATPICVNYTHGAALAVAAMILADGAPHEGLGWRRAAALLVAMAAALGDAAALAVWPVLALSAIRRRDWRWLTAVLVVGAVFVGLYASGQGADARSSAHGAVQDPADALRLSLNVLMLPWTRLSLGLAWIGGLLVALAGLATVLVRGGRRASRTERIACSFILFSLGVAAMAGLGRSGLPGALNVPLRYGVLLAPLHVGLLMLALPYAGALWRTNRRLAQTLCAAVLILAFVQNALMAVKVVHASDVVRTTLDDFRQGRRTPEMLVFVHPDLAHAERIYAGLRRDGLFQHELHLKPARPAG
jgi:MFS family permease